MLKNVITRLFFFATTGLFVFILKDSLGQTTDLPNIIPPSPEVSQLFRYQDYPVDYSTGLPKIEIPLFDIKSPELEVPITLSYHASGRRVYDQNGPIALGWSLNAGGMVSRTIYGSPDFGTAIDGTFKFPYPFKVSELSNHNDYEYFEKITHFDKNPNITPNAGDWMDSEYDVFSYYFNNQSGKIIFKDSNGIKIPVLLPYKPYKVIPHYTGNGLTGIDIIDDKGILYKFSDAEAYYVPGGAKTAFAITQIISADKADTIQFSYMNIIEERGSYGEQIVLNDNIAIPSNGNNPVINTLSDDQIGNHVNYYVERLKQIDFKGGKVVFNLGIGYNDITEMKVYNANNETIKTIQFNKTNLDQAQYSNFVFTIQTLSNITFKDTVGSLSQKYSFDYYPTASGNIVDVRKRDWWGYYNLGNAPYLVPRYNVFYIGTGGSGTYSVGNSNSERDPDLTALKSGMLMKITYPTGGSSEFIYENNKYYSNKSHQVKNGPGLRIAQINNLDNNGVATTRTFTYGIGGAGEVGYGILDMEPDITNMAEEYNFEYLLNYYGSIYPYTQGYYRQRIFYSDFIPSLAAIGERPIVYTKVTEYNGTLTNNIGKTVYDYDYSGWAPSEMMIQGKTFPIMHIYNYNYWDNPELVQKTIYKRILGGDSFLYVPIEKTNNSFQTSVIETIQGLHVRHLSIFPQDGVASYTDNPNGLTCEPYAIVVLRDEAYTYGSYQIIAGYKNLTFTTDTLYNDDGSKIVNNTSYAYNPRQLVNKVTKTESDGTNSITNYTYPFDYTGNSALTLMVNNNMLNYVVEQTDFKNTTPVKGIRTNYYNWGQTNPMLAPQTVEIKKGTGNYETRIHYFGYNANGRLLSVSKENDEKESFLWDYKNTLPIARTKNAAPSDIAFTSFEADGTGNWSGINPSNRVTSSGSLAGNKYYNFNGTTLSKTGLTSSKTYIVSYWSKSGSYTVSGNMSGWPKNIRTITLNGITWKYWEHRITGITTATITGTGGIDELRLYPSDALMSTYTYKPSVGMTTEDNESGKIFFYEYDGLGRLQSVRDPRGNILKTLKYHTVQ